MLLSGLVTDPILRIFYPAPRTTSIPFLRIFRCGQVDRFSVMKRAMLIVKETIKLWLLILPNKFDANRPLPHGVAITHDQFPNEILDDISCTCHRLLQVRYHTYAIYVILWNQICVSGSSRIPAPESKMTSSYSNTAVPQWGTPTSMPYDGMQTTIVIYAWKHTYA